MFEELEPVETFLRTIEHGEKPDDLRSVSTLRDWTRAVGAATRVTAADVSRARALRTALIAVLDRPLEAANRGALAGIAPSLPLRAGDPTASEPALVPIGGGFDATLARILAAFAEARANGTIERLKLCANCGFAFTDESRNRSRRWCEMTSCGNQSKVRAYRTRRRTTRVGTPGAP